MRIKMKLLSDALAGSGETFTGTVDRDIAFDERGLPFIPAKRIRGILRESMGELEFLGLVEPGTTQALFGMPGNSDSSPFRIYDGKIENADKLTIFLDRIQSEAKLSVFFAPRFILEHFSYLRTQTSVENGVAKENTLRISRVLKKKETFFFDTECPPKYKTALEATCAATRTFGSSRNRGLGAIRLVCEETPENTATTKKVSFAAQNSGNQFYEMPVSVRALSDLILSDSVGGSDDSGTYIPGTFLLGAFAAQYLSIEGNNASNPFFSRIFLSGKTLWCNLYPVPKQNSSTMYAPASFSIRKLKDREEYVDLSYAEGSFEEAHKGLGELFLASRANGEYYEHRPRMTIQYHHRRAEDPAYGRALHPETPISGDKGTFFQFQALEGKQFFQGSIIGHLEDLQIIASLLPTKGVLRLGKSRSAQYGKCHIFFSSPRPLDHQDKADETWENGDTLLFRLLSDAILFNDCGHPEPNPLFLAKELAQILDISRDSIITDEDKIFIHKRFIGGYLRIWNLPRIQYPALAAGSVIALKNVSGKRIDMKKLSHSGIGLRTADGFGRLTWNNLDDLEENVRITGEPDSEEFPNQIPEEAAPLVKGLQQRSFLKNLRKDARSAASEVSILPGSFIARLSGIIQAATNFKELNENIYLFRKKPAEKSLKKIAGKLFINTENLDVDAENFRRKAVQFDPVTQNITLRGLKLENLDVNYDHYREYAVAFLTALKLKGRESKS